METTFLNAAGTVLFVRDDMEQGNWTQEEYTVNVTFPYVSSKKIERGQRFVFRDPANNARQVFEIRNVNNIEPEHYQQFVAEHIVVSELSDEHINTTEITNKTAGEALETVLAGTLWGFSASTVETTSSVDISRGSVWQAVLAIAENWNAYITPVISFNSSGAIIGRNLRIDPAEGAWNGVRLSIDKNMLDSSVIYDDTEVLTALYGYGGNVDVPQTGTTDKTEELTFKDVVWTETSDHPAKPANQTYLEWPAKTALYGRNGRPRYGYYQNGDIKDAEVLLQKTWEALKETCDPKISITGTVADLHRLGYQDQPLKLHDLVIVEIRQTGEIFYKQIIKLDVDLIDPTATRPEIGDYIPNIIYINRDTDDKSSGGGGGGGRGMTPLEDEQAKTYTEWVKLDDQIGMVVGRYNGEDKIEAGRITLSINETTGESLAVINADHVNISATNTVYTLAGDLEHDANGRLVIKNAGGLYVQRTEQGTTAQFGVFDDGNLTGGICVTKINGQSGTVLKLIADVIDIAGVVLALGAYDIACESLTVGPVTIQDDGVIECTTIDSASYIGGSINLTGNASFAGTLSSTGSATVGSLTTSGAATVGSLTVGGTAASWQTYTARYCTVSDWHYFLYASSSGSTTPTGTTYGRVVNTITNTTIHYLGSAST